MVDKMGIFTDGEREILDWLVALQASGKDTTPQGKGRHSELQEQFERWRQANPDRERDFERAKIAFEETEVLYGSRLVDDSRLGPASFKERHPYMALGVAAAIVLSAIGGGFGLRHMAEDRSAPTLAYLDRVYATRVGERRQVSLPDGSVVNLDTDTIVRVRFEGNRRWLSLDLGRATFNVAHHDRRPFLVAAGGGMVIAHGTIFDVSVGAKGVHVALIQGAIEVRKKSSGGGGGVESRQLRAGEQVTFDSAHSISQPEPIAEGELSWHEGRLTFDRARLGEAVDEINRYNRRKITIADSGVADLRISGAFDPSDPSSFADAMAAANDLIVTSAAEGTILLTQKEH